eukprot:CAMPEP_0174244520 /NCGR_PEP_ID=MMETSP0417-20130205/35473_1 /TAXON_ID=242541 /ORGANISM="Mayorella sp, Strain BSH-02190019" /LENGTH=579 /DNA_ID=CAMNT_0015324207 /DNA_START=26 /DNA_END=1765 /DNA_ORIENTATION=+
MAAAVADQTLALEQSRQLVTEAVEHDTANRIAVAVVLYRQALRLLIPAARSHPHPETRTQLTQLAKQYLGRAEELRARLDQQAATAATADFAQSLALQLTVAAVARDQAASASAPPSSCNAILHATIAVALYSEALPHFETAIRQSGRSSQADMLRARHNEYRNRIAQLCAQFHVESPISATASGADHQTTVPTASSHPASSATMASSSSPTTGQNATQPRAQPSAQPHTHTRAPTPVSPTKPISLSATSPRSESAQSHPRSPLSSVDSENLRILRTSLLESIEEHDRETRVTLLKLGLPASAQRLHEQLHSTTGEAVALLRDIVPELKATGGVQSVFGRMAALKEWSDEAARILNETIDILYAQHLQQQQRHSTDHTRAKIVELQSGLADLKERLLDAYQADSFIMMEFEQCEEQKHFHAVEFLLKTPLSQLVHHFSGTEGNTRKQAEKQNLVAAHALLNKLLNQLNVAVLTRAMFRRDLDQMLQEDSQSLRTRLDANFRLQQSTLPRIRQVYEELLCKINAAQQHDDEKTTLHAYLVAVDAFTALHQHINGGLQYYRMFHHTLLAFKSTCQRMVTTQ